MSRKIKAPKPEPVEEENNDREIRDKLPYSSELMKRIAYVLDAVQRGSSIVEPLNNLHTILIPEVNQSIHDDIVKLRTSFSVLNRRFNQTNTIAMPTKFSRNTGIKIEISGFESSKEIPFSNMEERQLCWCDFGRASQYLQTIYKPRQVVNTPEILLRMQHAFASLEVEIIIAECHKRNLLLMTSKTAESGGLSLSALGEGEKDE